MSLITKYLSWVILLIKNYHFWKFESKKGRGRISNHQNRIILAESPSNIYLAIGMAILAFTLAKIKGASVLYFTRHKDSLMFLRLSFSNCKFFNVIKETSKFEDKINLEVNKILNQLNSPSDILEVEFEGIFIGDLIYDSSLREGYWQASIWKIDERVKKTTHKFIRIIFALKIIEQRFEVVGCCFTHIIGINGLPLRYFVRKKVLSVSGIVGSGPIRKHLKLCNKRLKYHGLIEDDLIKKALNSKKLKEKYLHLSESYLGKRLNGQLMDLDSSTAFSQQRKVFLTKNEFFEEFRLNPKNPNVFVMLHAFNDFPHHFEKNLFVDYYHWFLYTIKVIKEIRDVNWIIKEHPSIKFYPNDANTRGIVEAVNQPIKCGLPKASEIIRY